MMNLASPMASITAISSSLGNDMLLFGIYMKLCCLYCTAETMHVCSIRWDIWSVFTLLKQFDVFMIQRGISEVDRTLFDTIKKISQCLFVQIP